MITSKGLNFMMRLQLQEFHVLRPVRTFSLSLFSLFLICVLGMPCTVLSEEPITTTTPDLQLNSPGSLVICGGGILSWRLIERFVELGGGTDARVVLVTSASY